jgi:hypothetical protein
MPGKETGLSFTESEDHVQPEGLKPYARPEIVHDLALETRAGSPLSPLPDPLDPTGAGQ